ncbi:MAG: prepilin-type N-terminal cleavage/methylation domain-containing protein [Armatimonadetes bacterium]|nr:prepilin-type N-terminal cleavage/methylation domain-containing protein [Armatimonadota bacterium]
MKTAFTLIELLVVIAIIAILSAILFPVFARAKQSAKSTSDLSNAKQVGTAVKMYLNDNDDQMPIFYAYNSIPPAGQPGHKGVEVLLAPYCKNTAVFKSPFDDGGPFTAIDVPGSTSYWNAYGSSYRFTSCMYTVVAGESTSNNVPLTSSHDVTDTEVEFPSETRIMRLEMYPFFDKSQDVGCAKYGYDCAPPYNYYQTWDSSGGPLIFADSHAKHISNSTQFDQSRVDPQGHMSGEATTNPSSFDGLWYGICD